MYSQMFLKNVVSQRGKFHYHIKALIQQIPPLFHNAELFDNFTQTRTQKEE